MKIPNKLHLPKYQVVCYTKKGLSLCGIIKHNTIKNTYYCVNDRNMIRIEDVVCYERMRHTGKRVTQFLEREKLKQEVKSKVFREMKTPNISFGDSISYLSSDKSLSDLQLLLSAIDERTKKRISNIIEQKHDLFGCPIYDISPRFKEAQTKLKLALEKYLNSAKAKQNYFSSPTYSMNADK